MSEAISHQKFSHLLYEYGMLSNENLLLADDHQQQMHTEDKPDEPVIQFVNQLLKNAIIQTVSDIHLEPCKDDYRIRFRRDGMLYEAATLPNALGIRVMTRIKIMASLNIAERRLPQDGRFLFQPMKRDFRISTCPTLNGEKIVLRLLRQQAQQIPLSLLGMSTAQLGVFQRALAEPQGLIIVTGPTGCGKTSTLYSALQTIHTEEKNIVTVEDPVEIEMPGITQVNVNPRIGLSFAQTLRCLLRQDPDVIFIGEIRDAETAAIALQAAQTGHLVLSTLHTNHAMDSLQRLLALGVLLPQLAGSLLLLAAQRLIRKICQSCQGSGCLECRSGFAGRTGIFEVIPMHASLSPLLLGNAPLPIIEQQILQNGFQTLAASGLQQMKNGVTTEAELMRVLGRLC